MGYEAQKSFERMTDWKLEDVRDASCQILTWPRSTVTERGHDMTVWNCIPRRLDGVLAEFLRSFWDRKHSTDTQSIWNDELTLS